jgi:hypothetical protein
VVSFVADGPLANAVVWVDGREITHSYPGGQAIPHGGHSWVVDGNRYTATILRAITPVEPGPASVVVSLWETFETVNGLYLTTTAQVPGEPTRPVMPDTPSGQTIGPRTVRTLFHCTPADVDGDGILGDLRSAGVSHLTIAVFNSPGDQPAWDTFDKWRGAWEYLVRPNLDWCAANGFRVLATGDGFMRNDAERQWLATSPFAEQAVRYVAAALRDSGICDGIEMVDEVWGDPAFFDVTPFVSWWRAEGGPPLAWPNQYPVAWEVPELSDYSSRYGTDAEWRAGRAPPYALTVWQLWGAVRRSSRDVPAARPWLCLSGCTGPFYGKRVAGGDYQPGDLLHKGGMRAADVVAQVWMALAYGASGVRVYGYDWKLWRDHRANATVGTNELQTGARPGDARWPGVAAALSSVASREQLLLGTPYTPTTSGPWVFGRRGSLVWGVNTSERDLPSPNGPGVVVAPGGETTSGLVPAGCVILWE